MISRKHERDMSEDAYAEAMREIDTLRARVKELEAVDSWIPCSEREPEWVGTYLTWNANTSAGHYLPWVSFWSHDQWKNRVGIKLTPTHWRRLPDPPGRTI